MGKEDASYASFVEGMQTLRDLGEELQASPGGAKELARREDVINDIALLRDGDQCIVIVRPKTEDGLPFDLRVSDEDALDAYHHPYSYLEHQMVQEIRGDDSRAANGYAKWDVALDELLAIPAEQRVVILAQIEGNGNFKKAIALQRFMRRQMDTGAVEGSAA